MIAMARPVMLGILALFGAGAPAFADSCRNDLRTGRLGMIDMGGTAQAETLSSREAIRLTAQGGALTFRREIEDFWRVKVKRTVDPLDLEVRYHITGGSDRAGYAVSPEQDTQRFPVRLIPNAAKILCEDTQYRIISGGFTAQARAAGIGLAGLYELEIDVDVSER